MRLHRFFTTTDIGNVHAGMVVTISDPHITHQLSKVLRAKIGDPVAFFDGQGIAINGDIVELQKNTITLLVKEQKKHQRPKKITILYLAMLKRENFELAVQKATEIGISAIVPLLTERTIKTGFNRTRIEKIIIEAAEQSGRVFVPTLYEPKSFIQACKEIQTLKLFLDFDGTHFENVLKKTKDTVALYVGPEGGWTDTERALAKEAGCIATTLGTLTLRAETAAIVGSYLII
ncbi:MAG: 16S rRNA (uracil(1498)-N(3))-methyltransferase [Candidatus Pacebacteria bacterium]|jgi:16S rRNA (uracil1498-N3)-methyltransferase|nr:16S rRNA (uracil(1498)-N(3))-methyltransferase [Candidatus Paceibacterota bacterium]